MVAFLMVTVFNPHHGVLQLLPAFHTGLRFSFACPCFTHLLTELQTPSQAKTYRIIVSLGERLGRCQTVISRPLKYFQMKHKRKAKVRWEED